jgi:hypothetical protein
LRERHLHGGRQNDHVALQDEIGAGKPARPVSETGTFYVLRLERNSSAVGELGHGRVKRETGETCGTSETGHTRAELNSLPVFSEAAGVVSIARIERPPLHRGGSASTETMPAVSPLPSPPSLLVISLVMGAD